MEKFKSCVLTGGGTAGHVMPNIALVDQLKNHFETIYYLGTKDGIENQILKSYKDIKFIEVPAVKFRRSLSLKTLSIPFKLLSSIKKTKKILKEIQPNVIFSKGGYVAIPVAIAGKKLKINVISHESDTTLGLANKLIYPYCSYMCTSFKKTATKKKMIFTGSPIREQVTKGNKNNPQIAKACQENKKTILFFGGSLGAKAINTLVFDNILALTKKYNVLHIVGKGNLRKDLNIKNYMQVEFTDVMQDFYAACDMCVCRSGANTIFELLAIKKPALLIPLPKDESRGDQIENAQYFEKNGFCLVLKQEDASNVNFIKSIENLEKNCLQLKQNMSKANFENPNKKIVALIVRCAKN